ncbi:MAG: hypothetical protein ACLQVY_05830 [Limisphaerales bacterium]
MGNSSQRLKTELLRHVPETFAVCKEGLLALQESEPEPDISVVRRKPGDWTDCHPILAKLINKVALRGFPAGWSRVEVCAEDNVSEHWLRRLEARAADVYRQPNRCQYASFQTLTEQETWRCAGLPKGEKSIRDILPGSGEP